LADALNKNPMPRKPDYAYERLKARVFEDARRDLERSKPGYVAAFQATLAATGSPELASAKAKPLLKGGLQKWPAILTGFFDLEVVRGKVVDCHKHLERSRDSSAPDAGYWFAYHLDHWTFQTDAFLNRCDTLFKQVIRGTIRHRDPEGWQQFQNEVAAELQVLKDRFGELRHPLAHGLGGGVAGITERWESILAAPFDVGTSPEFVKSSMASFFGTIDAARRRHWFRAMHRANLILFAYSEAFSGKLLQKIDSLPS
jgi:hypothetical protein